jgi:non-homologous end joining protein Ku
MNFQELADEAFADLLRKHDRPTDLKDALKRSVKERSNSREDKPARRAPRGRHD